MKHARLHRRRDGRSDDEEADFSDFGSGDIYIPPTTPGDPYEDLKPAYTLPQIIEQLQTQWEGREGAKSTWTTKTIYYAIGNEYTDEGDGIPDWIQAAHLLRDPARREALSHIEAGYDGAHMTHVKAAAARLAFELWDDLIAIDMTEGPVTPGSGIAIAFSDDFGTEGRTFGRDGDVAIPGHPREYPIEFRRIWFGTEGEGVDSDLDFARGSFGLKTFMHEIGHSLGLSHPGTYDSHDGERPTYADDAEYAQDTQQYTLMSYFQPAIDRDSSINRNGNEDLDDDIVFAASPLLHDIAAIQDKYGADSTTRIGDTTYGFNVTADLFNRPVFDFSKNVEPVVAIWDGKGNDTLDVSGFKTDQRIDLHQGSFSDIGPLRQNVAIAFNCDIENAIGGGGNDTVVGNDLANRLEGGWGNDVIEG